MKQIKAKLYIYGKNKGGERHPWCSGIRPSFNINENLIMCKVDSKDKQNMSLNAYHNVIIEIPHGHLVEDYLKINAKFKLNCGARIIAEGIISEVLKKS